MNIKEKIYGILTFIEKRHIDMYFNITKEELDKYVDNIIKNFEIKDDYDLFYYINVIIKKIFGVYDSHTKFLLNDERYLPIRFKYINEKLYIVRTNENNKELLYGEVKKINDIDINVILDEIEKTVAYSTKEYLYSSIEKFLIRIYKLKSLPSISNDCLNFKFEIEKDNDIIIKNLVDSTEKINCGIEQIDNYQYKIINDIMYIVYNLNREYYQNQMKEFVFNITEITEKNNITKFIVDIRGNTGGNSNIINPLLDFLEGKEVITLVDKYVFSGGRFSIFDLKNINSKFVGTGIGTQLNCFGNAPTYNYDNYLIPISYSYIYMEDTYSHNKYKYFEEHDKFIKEKDKKELIKPQYFIPDYYIENTIEDYKNGIDRELKLAIDLIDKNKKLK